MYKYNIKNVNIDNCTNGHPILFVSCCCNVAVHIFGISSVLIILLLKKNYDIFIVTSQMVLIK